MKIAEIDNPVRFSWLADQGFRLGARSYVSEGYAARKLVERMPRTESLENVTERIFHPGRVQRIWTTDPEHGIPFLSSADIFQSDLSSIAMITRKSFQKNAKVPLEPGWTLITRSGMTAGRVTYARPDMKGYACSEDVLRVVPDLNKISAGYLQTFLASPLGVAMIKGNVYGTSVRHIEPSHMIDLPVPRIDDAIEQEIDSLFQQAMARRAQFQAGITEATRDLFESAGLPELIDFRWHDQPRDLDFSVSGLSPMTLRALNISPRAQRIIEALRSVPHRKLGEICSGGYLGSGTRFARVESEPGVGVKLIGQRQGFWMRPEGRWINPNKSPKGIFVTDETTMIAAQGTLGDSEVFCRALFVTGSWLRNAYTQHFLRVLSGDSTFPGAYLFAFLRSEVAFRILRSMSVGGKQQDIHERLRWHIPVPECTPADRERIAGIVRRAYRWRDEADALEDKAQDLLANAMREAAQ